MGDDLGDDLGGDLGGPLRPLERAQRAPLKRAQRASLERGERREEKGKRRDMRHLYLYFYIYNKNHYGCCHNTVAGMSGLYTWSLIDLDHFVFWS